MTDCASSRLRGVHIRHTRMRVLRSAHVRHGDVHCTQDKDQVSSHLKTKSTLSPLNSKPPCREPRRMWMQHFSLAIVSLCSMLVFFFLNDPAPPEFSPFPLPAALPIGGARHDSHRSLQVLEVDMTGMACGPKAAFATKGYFAHQRHRRGRQRGRVLATSDGEMVVDRSEEHTSELQSQSNLVCRLLLEKK